MKDLRSERFITGFSLGGITAERMIFDEAMKGLEREFIKMESAPASYVQAIAAINSASVISHIIMPNDFKSSTPEGARKKKRGELVRSALHITEKDIPHLMNRSVRDGYEHFDERLDQYLEDNPGTFADMTVGDLGQEKNQVPHIRRISYPTRFSVSILDKTIDLEDVQSAINKLLGPIEVWYRENSNIDS